MKRTFITNMPDESGAFLKASRLISGAGANITRVSYNKSVDIHMLFLDVSGTPSQLDEVSLGLEQIGYSQSLYPEANVMLLEFQLKDVPGSVTPILELIHEFDFNITYISSQETDAEYQYFKMGLLIEDPPSVKEFLDRTSKLCQIRVIEYNPSEKALDNTVFYMSFANQMSKKLGLPYQDTQELMTQSNRVMQLLDEKNEPPHKTFEYIGKFADFIHDSKGDGFEVRTTLHQLTDNVTLYCLEPPCGSNTYVVDLGGNTLIFVDTGFACFENELLNKLRELFPSFEERRKIALITHPDIDHCGFHHVFENLYVIQDAEQHLANEREGLPNFRELNPAHLPYFRISRVLTGYKTPPEDKIEAIVEEDCGKQTDPLMKIGTFRFGGYKLDVYKGNGGHAIGEAVFVDEKNKIVFCGDIVVNIEGFTSKQKEFNVLAPYLMTSVNMDSEKATEERDYLLSLFDPKEYVYCCGHGAMT